VAAGRNNGQVIPAHGFARVLAPLAVLERRWRDRRD
jgi:hypothetical protein